MQCGKQEEGRLESPLDAPWLQWCADFQDAARELAEREMTEGKVAFDPTDEVRPERQLLLLWLRRVCWWFCFLSGLSFRGICQGVSLASFMKSQALRVFFCVCR